MSPELETAVIGGVGTAVAQLLVVTTTLESGKWPARFRKAPYWLSVVLWIAVGGFVAWLNAPLPGFAAFQVGLSVKLVIAQLSKLIPEQVGPSDGAN